MNGEEIIDFPQDKGISNNNNEISKENRIFYFFIIAKCALIVIFMLFICDIYMNKISKPIKDKNEDVIDNKNNIENDDNFLIQEENKEIKNCDEFDPINVFSKRINNGPINICIGKNTKHICYANINNYYNDIFAHKNGVICLMENITLDPSKSEQSGYSYKGPVDSMFLGFPILNEGFLNTECRINDDFKNYTEIYQTYFNSWNYKYNEKEDLEELAPNKTILFISRNQDSPNLFHGNCEIINVISIMNLFNLSPENIQIIFLESIEITQDPFYDMYKNMISKGTEPIYIKNLKKKYKISKAIHVPINWDSPVFIYTDIIECKSSTIAYQLYNDLIDKYMDLKSFKDKFINDNMAFYYPNEIIKNNNLGVKFTKMVTIQWRRVWPKGRTKQQRLLGNGPSLADKLASELPNNILVRLVDTAQLDYKEQISIIRNTDYFVGIHGAGLSLGIFLPKESIYHEILKDKNIPVLALMSSLSGHKTYVDILKATSNFNDGNENVYFDEEIFVKSVLTHMKDNNFI